MGGWTRDNGEGENRLRMTFQIPLSSDSEFFFGGGESSPSSLRNNTAIMTESCGDFPLNGHDWLLWGVCPHSMGTSCSLVSAWLRTWQTLPQPPRPALGHSFLSPSLGRRGGRVGGSRFGKECWGVFVCVMSQARELRGLNSAQPSARGQFSPSGGWGGGTTNCLWKVFLVTACTSAAGALCNRAFVLPQKGYEGVRAAAAALSAAPLPSSSPSQCQGQVTCPPLPPQVAR